MATFGVWWCNYTSIRTYQFDKGYYREKIDEAQYRLEKCDSGKEDCSLYKKDLERYQKLLSGAEAKAEIAEKKCKLWDEIQILDQKERELNKV
jgi:hypothetical protein